MNLLLNGRNLRRETTCRY